MPTKLLYLLLVLTVISCAITKRELSNDTKHPIKHTKSIRYKAIEVNGQIIPGEYYEFGEKIKGAVVFHNYYGKNGRMIGHEHLDVNNKVVSKLERKFNEKNEVVELIEFDSKRRRMDTVKYFYSYENGMVKQLTKKSKSKVENHFFKYDSRGNKIAELIEKPSRKDYSLSSREPSKNDTIRNFYDYNKKNNLIKRRVVRPKGYADIYDFDGKGNLINQQTIDSTGNPIWGVTNKFDKRGNEIESIFFYDAKLGSKSYSKYNKKNQNIENLEVGPDGIMDSKEIFEYNLQGDWIKAEFYSYRPKRTPRKRRWLYKYDDKNNWIEKTYILNGEPQFITERQIDYY